MERRTELILRLPGLTSGQADRLAAALAPLAGQLGGSLSATERDHATDGSALHVGRRTLVRSGVTVGPRTAYQQDPPSGGDEAD